ncbi:MAG: hypothetical protein U0324_16515 [Polyangiales bacterium]
MRPLGRRLLTLSPLLLAALAWGAPAAAQDRSGDPDDNDGPTRTLGGHTFIPSQNVRAPFTASSVGSYTGVGYAGITVTPPNGDPQLNYQLAAAGLGFDFQLGLAPWWSVYVEGSGSLLSGINLVSALEAGASARYDARAGTTFSWAHRDRVRLGASIDAGYSPEYNFNIVGAIVNSISAGRVDARTLFTNTQHLELGGALQAAVTLHRAIGVFGEVRYTHDFTKVNDDPTNTARFRAGLGLSVDLHAVSPIPFGFLGTWRASAGVEPGAQLIHDVSAGFFYTARRHLVLGAEAQITLLPKSTVANVTIAQAVLLLRYYWQ